MGVELLLPASSACGAHFPGWCCRMQGTSQTPYFAAAHLALMGVELLLALHAHAVRALPVGDAPPHASVLLGAQLLGPLLLEAAVRGPAYAQLMRCACNLGVVSMCVHLTLLCRNPPDFTDARCVRSWTGQRFRHVWLCSCWPLQPALDPLCEVLDCRAECTGCAEGSGGD